uniref:Uncharacterized protein n=1 Tax=Lotus japonicus TaxID=34305 RepID=I3SR40_LOTJA|nr:unknown [Lotus japonicus]
MQTASLDSISKSDLTSSNRESSPTRCFISKGTGGGGNLAEVALTIILMKPDSYPKKAHNLTPVLVLV